MCAMMIVDQADHANLPGNIIYVTHMQIKQVITGGRVCPEMSRS